MVCSQIILGGSCSYITHLPNLKKALQSLLDANRCRNYQDAEVEVWNSMEIWQGFFVLEDAWTNARGLPRDDIFSGLTKSPIMSRIRSMACITRCVSLEELDMSSPGN